jgi:aryl-alcohol dehydrogenase-like predicted oxidoreductase
LASGVLIGKYNEGFPTDTRLGIEGMDWLKERALVPANIEIAKKLSILAKELGVSLPVLAIALCLKNENVSTVILGASKTPQLMENFKALEAKKKLTLDVMEKIEVILGNKPKAADY